MVLKAYKQLKLNTPSSEQDLYIICVLLKILTSEFM